MRLARPRSLAALAAGLALSACATSPPDNPDNACAIFSEKPGWWDAARDAERRWNVPASVQLAIIRQESGFDDDARPPRGRFLFIFPGRRPSSAYGYAQAIDSTWESYKKDTGRRFARRDRFRDASDFVGWYANRSRRLSGIALTDARHQYLAYHEGQAAYNRGSWRRKDWLISTAHAVSRTASRYERQLDSCRKRLNRRFLFLF
ncbi:MAG: transglycosylase SLT domain-containing protein [Caulobacterales bacterium]|nr:transglycosylase SLT domain-containing protein [Caulobacterales bacterium]